MKRASRTGWADIWRFDAMPLYDYIADDGAEGCAFCKNGFEVAQKIGDQKLTACPKCGGSIRKVVSAPNLTHSHFDLDYRAKRAGFSKLKRLGKGEYEKEY